MTHGRGRLDSFEDAYERLVAGLSRSHTGDDAVRALALAEEARTSSGSDDFEPDWLRPFLSIAAALISRDRGRRPDGGDASYDDALVGLEPIVLRAVQLGYTEGYFAGKDD